MKFLKENSYDIFRLFLNQIALAVFGLVMSVATQFNDSLFMAFGVFGILFYCVICYLTARNIGEKDFAPVSTGRRKATPLKGLWIGILANSVNIICGILVFVASFFLIYQPTSTVFDENGAEISVFVKPNESAETKDAAERDDDGKIIKVTTDDLKEVKLYTDLGDDIYTYDNGKSAVSVYEKSKASGADPIIIFDKDGNRLSLYSLSLYANTEQNTVENWASNVYSIPAIICKFLQVNFVPIQMLVFNNADWYFLITPVLPIIAVGLGYYLSSKNKRLFAFIPERKAPRRFF